MIKKLCILLHGYGADDKDLASLIPVFKDRLGKDGGEVDFISVPAPNPCDLGQGLQWFSLNGYWEAVLSGKDYKISEQSLSEMRDSLKYLDNIISKELDKRSFSREDLILIGFSQGSAIAMDYALTCDEKIGKCISFSGFISNENVKNKSTPFLLCHGENDDTIPLRFFEKTKEFLLDNNVELEWVVSPNTGHWISEEGMDKAVEFIKN